MSGENSRLEEHIRRLFAPIVLAALAALVVGWLATDFFFEALVPSWLARVQSALGKDVNPEVAAEIAARLVTVVLTFLGGLVVAGMWVWRNIISSRQAEAAQAQANVANTQAETARMQAEVALKTQISTDLAKAYEQLGSEHMAVRIGAIYTLEKVMRDVQDTDFNLYWSIIETLSGFARERSRDFPTVDELADLSHEVAEKRVAHSGSNLDICCVLTVIGRRRASHDDKKIDLSRVFAAGFSSPDRVLDFSCCDINFAVFVNSKLSASRFASTSLVKGCFLRADLSKADLVGAKLWSADLRQANLSDAMLDQAVLLGAYLGGTDICGTNLQGAVFLEQSQVEQARGDARTLLPQGLERPIHWDDDGSVEFEFDDDFYLDIDE